MRRVLFVLAALTVLLAACGSDDGDPAPDQAATDDTGAVSATGEVDTEQLTETLRAAIVGDNGTQFDPQLEVTEADVGADGTTGLVIAPVDPSATLTQEQADQVCAAVASVVLREVPTAVTIVADGDGTPLAATTGAAGSCEATTESVDEILSVD